jgi:acetyl-CoA carboxylase biotin carboxyl carrier protein
VSGQVMEILVQNGEPVEYGQVLMRINPDWKITLLLWNKC